MKLMLHDAQEYSDIVFQKLNNGHLTVVKDRYADPMHVSVETLLASQYIKVSIVDEGKVIIVNRALQKFLESQGYEVPNEITIKSVS